MHPVVAVAARVAAGIHVWIFLLESVWFMRPSVHRRFGLASEEQARVVRSFAYNQGFYNLFLAAGAAGGVALAAAGDAASGCAITLFACGSMVAAGIVLFRFNPRGAVLQAGPPLVAVLAQVVLG